MKRFLSFLLFVSSVLPLSALPKEERPNIVFMLADDLGINDLGSYGRAGHRTPNLDRLGAEGKRFTNAYAPHPVCSPTRAALLSGQCPARLQLTNFLPGRSDWPGHRLLQPPLPSGLPTDAPTLGEKLQKTGYATACIGKWHLGNRAPLTPESRGFDFVFAGKPNTTPTAEEGGKGEFGQVAKAEEFLQANDISKVNNIVLIHLSDGNSHAERFKREVKEQTVRTVNIAEAGLDIPFNKTPF
jgi:arylsulfatase A-like enzyme